MVSGHPVFEIPNDAFCLHVYLETELDGIMMLHKYPISMITKRVEALVRSIWSSF